MKDFCPSVTHFLITLTLTGCVSACAGSQATQTEAGSQNLPVTWTQEFDMATLLDQPPAVSSQKVLRKLLDKPWYTSINIQMENSSETRIISSCEDHFGVETKILLAQQDQEQNALAELAVMCEATHLLSQATPSQQSYIPPEPLNAALPDKLPKSIALVTSQAELDRINSDQSISSWSDVNAMDKVERTSKHQSQYRSGASLQTITALGRGDFNGDGTEDLLVRVKDVLEGGNYFNLRLFMLTVTDQGDWQAEAQF